MKRALVLLLVVILVLGLTNTVLAESKGLSDTAWGTVNFLSYTFQPTQDGIEFVDGYRYLAKDH